MAQEKKTEPEEVNRIFETIKKTICTIEIKEPGAVDFIPYHVSRLDFFRGYKIIPSSDLRFGFGIQINSIGPMPSGRYFPMGTELRTTIKEEV